MHYFLRLEIWQRPNEIVFSKEKYVIDILKRFGMLRFLCYGDSYGSKSEKARLGCNHFRLVDPAMYK